MESLYLLVPLSVGLVLLILAIFAWALHRGQFEELEGEAERILQADVAPDPDRDPGPDPDPETPAFDADQGHDAVQQEQSRH
jgi:cbb3-type cytochrome oxidase maturation protein